MSYLPQQGGCDVRGPFAGGRSHRPASAVWSAIRPTTTTTAAWTSSSRAGPGSRTKSGRALLRNHGAGGFDDVTKEAGLLDPVNSNAAAWADYDNDGWIDLFIACERQPNRLYHNKGNGTFEEVAGKAGVAGDSTHFCKGCTWIDYDNDRLSRPVHQQSGRAGRALSQQSRRHLHGRHVGNGHRRSLLRLLVLGLGLRQ